MLTIQPGILQQYKANPAFERRKSDRAENIQQTDDEEFREQEREYNSAKSSIENARENILETVENAPKPVKTTVETLAVGATALIGGMTVGWGGRKSIQAIKEVFKTQTGAKFLERAKDFKHSFVEGFKELGASIENGYKNLKSDFKETSFYEKSKAKYDNFFDKTTFGQKLVSAKNKIKENSVYQSVSGGVKRAYEWCRDGMTNIYRKLAGIKGKQVENATVNTLGVAGGAASGVTALKEQAKENKIDNNDIEDLEE